MAAPMATQRMSTIGRWLQVKQGSHPDVARGEIALCTDRWVNDNRAGDNRTSLAIFADKEALSKMVKALKLADPSAVTAQQVFEQEARLVFPDCNNRSMSKIFGAREWEKLSEKSTARVNPDWLGTSMSGTPIPLLVGKEFTATVPVYVSGEIQWYGSMERPIPLDYALISS